MGGKQQISARPSDAKQFETPAGRFLGADVDHLLDFADGRAHRGILEASQPWRRPTRGAAAGIADHSNTLVARALEYRKGRHDLRRVTDQNRVPGSNRPHHLLERPPEWQEEIPPPRDRQ